MCARAAFDVPYMSGLSHRMSDARLDMLTMQPKHGPQSSPLVVYDSDIVASKEASLFFSHLTKLMG
jgi:hypothetical protein